jgi:radical SAM superfamily enzyme YgiQ (UPF0313 family)
LPEGAAQKFHFVMIKPSHYDDDGYVIQWLRSPVPSNSLAVLHGLAQDCAARRVLGEGVELVLSAYDETNARIRVDNIAARLKREGGGLIGLVGVQSNQFPRAMDLARRFRAAGLPVAIGGFHVSGTLAMLPGLTPELQEAIDLGIALFAGEAEGRLEGLLQDARAGTLKPIYNFISDLPGLEGEPTPFLPAAVIGRTARAYTSFDAGRGCPFQCSFCTIINVQGRKSRYRGADDVEQVIRANLAQGIHRFFITDDNFARNRNWEAIFDRLIALRREAAPNLKLIIQVDLMCHRIPHFIDKAAAAGVREIFIGLESINPDTLIAAKKRQNKITEYRTMLQAWRRHGVLIYAGYIVGFPTDTAESVARDIAIIQEELPVDILEFFMLTPLPGSEDHQKLFKAGAWLDPDLNAYDGEHPAQRHPLMTPEEWTRLYWRCWELYYTPAHVERLFRRAGATGSPLSRLVGALLWFYGSPRIERRHPLDSGVLRRKVRRDRRPGMPLESPLAFYPRYAWHLVRSAAAFAALWWRCNRWYQAVRRDPAKRRYTDLSLTPVREEELDELALFTATEGGHAAVERARRVHPAAAE